jgi:thermosome
MPEDSKRTTGKDAQANNIAAAKAVADMVRTTLGPKGMDKMIVDASGDITVTNDGVTILRETQIEHPAAKMMVEIAKTQEDVVGDGTTTAVIIAGELLKRAESLLEQKIHPTVLAKGYRMAQKETNRILNEIAEPINSNDILKQIALTAMTGKGAEGNKEHLANLCVQAIVEVKNLDDVKVEKQVSSDESQLIKGIVLDKERVHPSMPTSVEQARIALLDTPLEIKNTEIDAKIQITDPTQLNAFLEQEERTLQQMVARIKVLDANVVFCQRGIDEVAQHFLTKAGILAIRRVKKSDIEFLVKATNAKIISNLKDATPDLLGQAGHVYQTKIGEEEMVFVEQCSNPRAVTLLVKGSTEHIAQEVKRAVDDALGDLATAVREGKVVAGAGAVEMAVAKQLRRYAATLIGREQLAAQAFADTLEIIPRTLAENAGLDPIDVLTKLRAAQHKWPGVNVHDGEVIDAFASGILEPLKVKTQALSSATEVAEMILRIDDVIMGNSKPDPSNHLQM